jgi:hypothetical protein
MLIQLLATLATLGIALISVLAMVVVIRYSFIRPMERMTKEIAGHLADIKETLSQSHVMTSSRLNGDSKSSLTK